MRSPAHECAVLSSLRSYGSCMASCQPQSAELMLSMQACLSTPPLSAGMCSSHLLAGEKLLLCTDCAHKLQPACHWLNLVNAARSAAAHA